MYQQQLHKVLLVFCEADRISQNRCRQGLCRLRKFLPSFPQEKKKLPKLCRV